MDRIDADNWSAKDVARLLALVESEKRYYQDILTLFPVPAAVVGRDLTLLSVNREFRKRFLAHAMQAGEDHTHRVVDVLHATVVRQHVVPVFEKGASCHDAGITVLDERGVGGFWLLDAIPLPDVHRDSPKEALLVLRAVAHADSGLCEMLDQTATVVWKLDTESGDIEFGNQAAHRTFGFGGVRQWMQRVYGEDERRVAWVYEAVVESGREATVEYRMQPPGREPVWVADQIVPVKRQGARTGVLHIVTSVQGERRASMANLVQGREMASSARLARQVAHEFNNLWMIVNGYAEVLEERADADMRASLEEITKAAQRGMETTRQLLEFARPATAQNQAFDLHKELPAWELDAELHLPPGVAPVSADPERLKTSLSRLIEFARKRAGVDARLRIDTVRETRVSDFAGGEPTGQFVVLRLSPIAAVQPSTLEHWCEPYFSESEKAVPIGLAATYTALRQMGATVRLQGGPIGEGSFLIAMPLARLPQVERAKEPEPVREPRPVPPPPPPVEVTRETVLVVDAEESIRGLVGRVLEREGYRVLTAATGLEAKAAVANEPTPVALLITDMTPDGENGLDLAEGLQAIHPGLGVLFLSSSADDAIRMEDLPSGVGFLQKPFTISSLSSMVRTVLDASKN